MKTLERRQWYRFGIFIFNFEFISQMFFYDVKLTKVKIIITKNSVVTFY